MPGVCGKAVGTGGRQRGAQGERSDPRGRSRERSAGLQGLWDAVRAQTAGSEGAGDTEAGTNEMELWGARKGGQTG